MKVKVIDEKAREIVAPFAVYEGMHLSGTFENHIEKVQRWFDSSICDVGSKLSRCSDYMKLTEENKIILEWLKTHEIVCLDDFSAVSWGIVFNEEIDMFSIRYPLVKTSFFDYEVFRGFTLKEKLEWLSENCESIPFRYMYETISVTDGEPYKFSHIQRDEYVMSLLSNFLETSHRPNPNAYYTIHYSAKTHNYYLKRFRKDAN